MRHFALAAVIAVCILIIAAAALDLRCGAVRPAPDTIVLACRAGRLAALSSTEVQP